MLDINFIRENTKEVKENLKRRNLKTSLVDDFIGLDKEWRELKSKVDSLRSERNKLTLEITKLSKEKKDVNSLVKKAKALPQEIKDNEDRLNGLREDADKILFSLPN